MLKRKHCSRAVRVIALGYFVNRGSLYAPSSAKRAVPQRDGSGFLTSPPKKLPKRQISPSPQGEGERKKQIFFKETNTRQQLQEGAGVGAGTPAPIKPIWQNFATDKLNYIGPSIFFNSAEGSISRLPITEFIIL